MHIARRCSQYLLAIAIEAPTADNRQNCLLIRKTRHPNNLDHGLLEVVTGGY